MQDARCGMQDALRQAQGRLDSGWGGGGSGFWRYDLSMFIGVMCDFLKFRGKFTFLAVFFGKFGVFW